MIDSTAASVGLVEAEKEATPKKLAIFAGRA
jgi:hypothetical protein